MGAIRIIGGVACVVLALPVCAQPAEEPRLTFANARTETRVTLNEQSGGLWLRASTTTRGAHEPGGADGRTAYRFSLQKEVVAHAWIGIGTIAQLPRFDPVRGQMRGLRNAVGPKLSFEAGSDVELGFSWMKRKRRGAPPPGPRAYASFRF